jgi:hypothetical protein
MSPSACATAQPYKNVGAEVSSDRQIDSQRRTRPIPHQHDIHNPTPLLNPTNTNHHNSPAFCLRNQDYTYLPTTTPCSISRFITSLKAATLLENLPLEHSVQPDAKQHNANIIDYEIGQIFTKTFQGTSYH